MTVIEWMERLTGKGDRQETRPVTNYPAESPVAKLFQALNEVKQNVKTAVTNPREKLYQVDQDAKRFNELPEEERTQKIVEGVGGLGIIGKASLAAPYKLQIFEKLKKEGLSDAEAYKRVGGLPLLNKKGEVDDIGTPLIRWGARTNLKTAEDFYKLKGDEVLEKRLEELYNPEDIQALIKHAPDVANMTMYLKRTTDKSGGGFYPNRGVAEVSSPRFDGKWGIKDIASHEGTHAYQEVHDMPRGGNATYVAQMRSDGKELANHSADAFLTPKERSLYAWYKDLPTISPGKSPKEIAHLSPEAQELVKVMAWNRRLQEGLAKPDDKLYKALHGEQVAEAAWMHSGGQPMKFTTPLSKHLLDMQDLSTQVYRKKLEALYDLKQQGRFDPAQQPYSLPPKD